MMSQQQMWRLERGGEADASFKSPGNHVEKVYGTSPSDQERDRDWSDGL